MENDYKMSEFLKQVEEDGETNQYCGDDESVYKIWFFDVQWTDCPKIVRNEIHQAWREDDRLTNDVCILKYDMDAELEEYLPLSYLWLKHKGVEQGERVIIHWWW